MQSAAKTPEEYLASLPEDRKEAMEKLRDVILNNLPKGFEECMAYGMLGYVVPLSLYPAGYHCTPNTPLPFLSIASQKNFIGFYHMGMYSDKELYNWFVEEFPKHSKYKLDMGKSCVRFKKVEAIPYDLIAELVAKIAPERWIALYESQIKR
ncbi:hypothetical protein GCM10007424_21720 [Flavobacterium suaedae]|uniref:YdhG-like domain-containing protein n=1 Tax=Flavobacterium suaedae TaxID=1767027 RepID=A0ABQ1K1B8_9FLAO|nr:DUF1801 domain-containing protein [Flavobacterium suaedae]GGB81273.1 hypothetical protein GCM10007424_21720 [Flavobacterium suaedae]